MDKDTQKHIDDLLNLITGGQLDKLLYSLFLVPSDPDTIQNITADVIDGKAEFDHENHTFRGTHGAEISDQAQQTADIMKKLIPAMKESFRRSMQDTADFLQSDAWKELADLFGCADDDQDTQTDVFLQAANIYALGNGQAGLIALSDMREFADALRQALPYIPGVLKAYKKESGADRVTLALFVAAADPVTGEPAESLLTKCLAQAAGPDIAKELPILKGVVPENYIITNDLVSNSMTKGLVNAGSVSLDPSQGHKGKYKVYAAITLDPNKYAVNGNFTKNDRRVFNGICSLIAAGNDTFTAETVFRAMNGLSNSEKVTSQQEGSVTKSINKLRDIDIRIDATEEFKARKIIDKDADISIEYEDKCLKAGKLTVKAGGRKKTGYKVTENPLLYDYARKLGQIISIPAEMLTIKDESGGRISNTDKFSVIKEYLLQRIEIMKSQKRRGQKVNTTIDINTFYEETDNDSANGNYKTPAAEQTAVRKKKLKAREQAAQCLDYWTRTDYINGYKMREKKHVVTAIEIQL